MARKAQQTVERSMVLGGIGSQMLLRSNYGAALDAEADAEAGASIAVFDNRGKFLSPCSGVFMSEILVSESIGRDYARVSSVVEQPRS